MTLRPFDSFCGSCSHFLTLNSSIILTVVTAYVSGAVYNALYRLVFIVVVMHDRKWLQSISQNAFYTRYQVFCKVITIRHSVNLVSWCCCDARGLRELILRIKSWLTRKRVLVRFRQYGLSRLSLDNNMWPSLWMKVRLELTLFW